ncbi:titin-like [Schistocerca americana]|uniref:titin-like n=1 Tax=Schistocerca americana TaxID=7009 RepID=UPI001F4FF0FC|nr:titin-like [Schistocerca americana]
MLRRVLGRSDPHRSPAASRQPDADGFVVPPRWRTATASALQKTQPLATANTFAGASVDAPGDGDAPLAPPQKNPTPPPHIVVQWDGVYKHFQQKLERVATSTTVKAVGRDLHRAATLPHTRQQELGVPPRASPAALQEFAGPAAVASVGVAPLDSTIREVNVPPFAPPAPETQEEPVPALVEAPSYARGNPAVWTGAQSAAEATEVAAIELPGAKLSEEIAEAERRDIDPDDARAPRKRLVVTHDDSDNASLTSDTARPRKKASRASRASTTEAVKTVASSSRSTAKPRPTTKTQRPSRSPAASRQPDADAAEDGDAPLALPQKKPPPPPPIVVQWDGAYMDFQQKLDRVATSTTVKAAGRDL